MSSDCQKEVNITKYVGTKAFMTANSKSLGNGLIAIVSKTCVDI